MQSAYKFAILSTLCAVISQPLAAAPASLPPFNQTEASWFKHPGKNSLTGTASLKGTDGKVHTCAHVQLSPATKYSAARIKAVFGSDDPKFESVAQMPMPPKPDPAGDSYQSMTTCDNIGHFEFSGLPDGDYYLVVEVAWPSATGTDVGNGERIDGGAFGRRVQLRGGQTRVISFP